MTTGPALPTPAGQEATSSLPERPTDVSAPWWFDTGVLWAGASLASLGVLGVAAAMLGVARTWLVLPLAAAAGSALALWARPRGRSGTVGDATPGVHRAAAAALLLALGFTMWTAWAPSQHVRIDRDPGSYTATARWIARDGSLDAVAGTGGLYDPELLRVDGLAVYDVGDGRVEFQFTHFSSAVMAAAYDVAGARALFRVPALVTGLGLLALYSVAVRVTGRPWAALVALAATALCLPVVHVARDTFSEPFAFALLWAAALAGSSAARSGHPGRWALTGVLFGAAVAARPDTAIVAVVAAPLVVVHLRRARRRGERVGPRVAALTVGLAVTAGVGLLDLLLASGGYAGRHGGEIAIAVLLAAATGVAAAVGMRLGARAAWPRWWIAHRQVLSDVGAALVGTAFVLAWFVRPRVQQMSGATDVDLVAALQQMEGVAVEPARRYGELSVVWLSWYLGPITLATAIVGLVLAVRTVLRGRAGPALVLVTASTLVVSAVSLWRPTITPDHIWAMRRYVPVVLPALAVFAALVVARVAAGAIPAARTVRSAMAVGLAAVLVAGPLWTTWPLRSTREQHGSAAVLEQACELIGADASVVVVGRPEADVLVQPLRSWCGVPAAAAADGIGVDDLDPVRAAVEREGRTLTLVASDPAALSAAGDPVVTDRAVETRQVERTLLGPPRRYLEPGEGWSLAVLRVGE